MAQISNRITTVISDFDDTIRDSVDGYIPESFWSACDRLRARGIEVIVATGRSRHSLVKLLKEDDLARLKLSPGVFSNGSVIYDRADTPIVQGSFSELEGAEIFEFLKVLKQAGVKLEIGVSGLKASYGYVLKTSDSKDSELIADEPKSGEKTFKFLNEEVIVIDTIQEIFLKHDDIPLSFCWLCDDPATNSCVHKLMVKVFPSLNTPDSLFEFNNGFMIDPRIGKAKAIRALCKNLKINENEVVVIGDGTNDISMLDAFENSIVMGNATDWLKAKHGKYVAPCLVEDGWARGVEAYIDKILESTKASTRADTNVSEPLSPTATVITSCTAS